jgi:AcrR family transcriptional regulator
MTKGNLYYYFRHKEEMLFVCHDYSLDMLLKMLKRVEGGSLSPKEKLHQVIVGFVRITIHELRGTMLLLDLEGLGPRRLRNIIQKRDSFDHGIRRIIEAGMAEGTFRKGDAKLITFAILGALNWIARWFLAGGPVTFDQIGEAFARYLIAGLLVDRASRRSRVRPNSKGRI